MAWVMAAATVVGAGVNYISSQNAANTQAGAANHAADLQRDNYNKSLELNRPYNDAGLTAQQRMFQLLGLSTGATGNNTNSPDFGKYGKDFSMSDFTTDPGYAFRLKEGLKSLDTTASKRSGLLSGSAIKAATRYGQDYGSQEYQNAFNRYQVNRNNQLSPLQDIINRGQSTANMTAQAGQSYATNAGEAYQNAGNAQAAGSIAGGNALAGGINSYLKYQQGNDLINSLRTSSYAPQSSSGYDYAGADYAPPVNNQYYG